MSHYLQQHKHIFVLGLGMTGLSCLTYLCKKAQQYDLTIVAADSRALNDIEDIKKNYPLVHFVEEDVAIAAAQADLIISSPGIGLSSKYLAKAKQAEVTIIGDVELFAAEVNQSNIPVIAITGSNGKSTVTDLVSKMLSVDFTVAMGGNIGKPVLSLLDEKNIDVYVLELSSFQLETTYQLNLLSALVINITPDHMDRYDNFSQYQQAKLRIFNHATHAMYCRDEHDVEQAIINSRKNEHQIINSFGLSEPNLTSKLIEQYGIKPNHNSQVLCKGNIALIDVNEIALQGKHNWLNVMAAYSLAEQVYCFYQKDLMSNIEPINQVIMQYQGLPHRCEKVLVDDDVLWINDSKATNPESSMAALKGFSNELTKNIIWIVGGVGKGADFSPLKKVLSSVKHIILFGQDAPLIIDAIQPSCSTIIKDSMDEVVDEAISKSVAGDVVLFSPACASFDKFQNFEHRGDVFKSAVNQRVVAC